MTPFVFRRSIPGSFVALALAVTAFAAAADDASDVVKRNLAAAGGEARLAAVRSLSFKAGSINYTATPAGTMKAVVEGLPPAVLEAVLVAPGRVVRRRPGGEAEVGELERARLTLYARLFGGGFTLRGFADGLRYDGLRRFGPESFHRVRAEIPPATVEFDLDTAEGLIRQVALRALNPDGSRYEEFFDFGPYQDVQGLRLPGSWFRSTVGGRGSLSEFSDFAFDAPLPPDFFERADINIGEAKVEAGRLEGRTLALLDQGRMHAVVTNWTPGQAAAAGLVSGDPLALIIEGLEYDAVFYASSAEAGAAGAFKPGTRILSYDPEQGETLWAAFLGPSPEDAAAIKKAVKGLSPVAVRKR